MTPKLKTMLDKFYGDAEGPFGYRMRSDMAKEAEALWKTLPKECRDLGFVRALYIPKSMEFVSGEHADISFVTTNSIDRDREVVLAAGGDWKQFRKNPVVPFAHDYSSLPVGRAEWVARDTKGALDGWKAKTVYMGRPDTHPKEAEWFPDTVYSFVKEGFMPGKSIGFVPLNYREVSQKEAASNPDWKDARGVIDKWMALEYSPVAVQSNVDALVENVSKMKKKGVCVTEEFFERVGLMIPDHKDAGVTAEDDDGDNDAAASAEKANNAKGHWAAMSHHETSRNRAADSGVAAAHDAAYTAHVKAAGDHINSTTDATAEVAKESSSKARKASKDAHAVEAASAAGALKGGAPAFTVIKTTVHNTQTVMAAAQSVLAGLNPQATVQRMLNRHKGKLD